MIRVKVEAAFDYEGDRYWRSATYSYLFCTRGPRLLGSGVKWKEGVKALVEVSRRPIKGGAKVRVFHKQNAEVNGVKLRGRGHETAVSFGLVATLREHGLIGLTIYVRMTAIKP